MTEFLLYEGTAKKCFAISRKNCTVGFLIRLKYRNMKNPHSETSENFAETIMAELRSGRIEALEQLYEVFSANVFNYALRILRNRAHAEDITQEVFIRVWRYKDRYSPEKRFKGWIMQICLNLCRDLIKKKESGNVGLEVSQLPEAAASDGPEALAIEKQETELFSRAFYLLSPAQQQLLALRFDGDLTVSEVAQALGCSIRTIHYQTARAIEQLRTIKEGGQDENA
jgi:RNA polymerase sigma-70 factor (ECF subfamily)